MAFALLLAAAAIYWPSSEALAGLWSDTRARTYTHGWLVLLICLWLIARARMQIASMPVRPVPGALAAVLLLSAGWLLFWRAGLQDLHLVIVPALVLASLLAVFGWGVARRLAFGVGFFYFALPLWGDLVGVLQPLSVKANGLLIWLTGLPAYIDGNLVHVPAGTFEVAGGCSGLHFLIVGLALAALYGELLAGSLGQRTSWLLLMSGLALVCNWMRIFAIVVAGYATDMRSFLVTVDHYWFGWLVFACGFATFLWMAGRTVRGSRPAHAMAIASPDATPDLSAVSCITALVCMAVLPLAVYLADLQHGRVAPGVSIDWPSAQTGWSGPRAGRSTSWRPEFHNATVSALREYVDASGRSVEIFSVAYRLQQQGVELVAYDNSVLGSDDT
ncbi:MAG: exosortase, partial [Steroidobacteraceae bacterium]